MIGATGKFRRRLSANTRGIAAVEFAILAIPMFILIFGALDLGYQNYLRSTMQGSLNDIGRIASVETPNIGNGNDTVEQRIEDELEERIDVIARNADITVTQRNYTRFSSVNQAEKLLTDINNNGQYDSGDCWEDANRNRTFDASGGSDGRGGADDVVFYDVNVVMPRLFPMAGLVGADEDYDITVSAAFRNQPYANQTEPPVECG